MRVKYIFFIILIYTILAYTNFSWAQTLSKSMPMPMSMSQQLHTTGVVLNNLTYQPIRGAKAILVNRKTGKSVEMKTKSNGNFKFPIEQASQYVLSVESGLYAAEPTYISTSGQANLKVHNFIIYIDFNQKNNNKKDQVKKENMPLAVTTTPLPPVMLIKGKLEDYSDLRFAIKIGAFVQPLPVDAAFLAPIQHKMKVKKMENGWVEYTVGKFENYQKALIYQEELEDKGYVDTKIIAYQKNKVVDITHLVGKQQQNQGKEKLISDR